MKVVYPKDKVQQICVQCSMLSHAFTVLSAEILFLGLDQGTDSSNQMHSGRSYGYKSNKTIVMAEFDSKIFEATKT